jgi:membrane protease YdiL (CAAX protease family)
MPPQVIESSNGLVRCVRRNQLLVFVVLAYALSWWAWIWYRLDPVTVDAPILPIGPLLAALIVLAVVGGWTAIKDSLRKIVHWRVGWQWYALALLLPVALTLSAFAINLLLGAQRVASIEVPDAGEMAFRFVFIFLFIGLGEEPGWRGFALPHLLLGRTALAAALIVGLIHLVWHAPLYGVEYDSANVWPWGSSVVCYSVVICWIYLHTGGSILMPMLMHASNNTIAFVWRMFEGGDQLRLWWIWCALWVITAIIVVLATGPNLASGKRETSKAAHG